MRARDDMAVDRRVVRDDAAVEISDLTLNYGSFVALQNINVEVRQGEFMALLGPSGCGKTSLLRSIAGYVNPQFGSIRINGRDVVDLRPQNRNIGMVFQNYALFPHMTAAENVAFGLRCRRTPRSASVVAVKRILDIVGLSAFADRKPRQLSGGQQQRVALARALVIQPDVLLLDEALSALDKALRIQMQTELKEIQRRFAITSIFVTHDQEEAMAMADTVAVMRGGRIEQLDTPSQLFQAPATPWVADFIGAGNLMRGIARQTARDGRVLDFGPGIDPIPVGDDMAAAGARVAGFVRADRVALRLDESGVEIVGRRFLGSRVELVIRDRDAPLRAMMSSDEAEDFTVGRRVRINVPSRHLRLLDGEGISVT